jgi:hypothetical protein
LFALAAALLARKPIAISVPPDARTDARLGGPRAATTEKSQPASTNGESLASLDQMTATSLDHLKDRLFRLELRRQAGTISEEEYARERAQAERVLRELVRG